MKKFLSMLLAVAMLFSLCVVSASAAPATPDSFECQVKRMDQQKYLERMPSLAYYGVFCAWYDIRMEDRQSASKSEFLETMNRYIVAYEGALFEEDVDDLIEIDPNNPDQIILKDPRGAGDPTHRDYAGCIDNHDGTYTVYFTHNADTYTVADMCYHVQINSEGFVQLLEMPTEFTNLPTKFDPEPDISKPTDPEPIVPDPTVPDPTVPDPTDPEPTEPEPTEPEPTEPESKDGWVKDNSGWHYTENGKSVSNKWRKDGTGWCYLDANGKLAAKRWAEDSHGWCWLDKNGHQAFKTWAKDSKDWCYVGNDGYMVTNAWAKDSHGWCYLGADGHMTRSKWVRDYVDWCYVDKNGYMVTDRWVLDSQGWCYLGADGRLLRNGYAFDSTGRHHLNASGHMDW